MPSTVGVLQAALSRFVPREDSFVAALNQVGPKLLAMGNWRETVKELEIRTSHPYVTLPRGFGSLLAGMVDSVPVLASSRWHDYKIIGMAGASGPAAIFGLIDDGLQPVLIDLRDGDATGEEDYQFKVEPVEHGKTVLPLSGSIQIYYTAADDVLRTTTFTLAGAASMITAFASGAGAVSVERITYSDVPEKVKISAVPVTAGTTFQISEGRLDEESEFRRYRVENSSRDRTVGLLMKQRWTEVRYPSDLVPFTNLNLVKNGLLAIVAEDASDLEASQFHWGVCEELLEKEMSDYRGGMRPRLNFDPFGIGEATAVNLM